MAFQLIPQITCRRCGNVYSGLRSRCPKCNAPRANQSTRAAATTAAATGGTAARVRAEINGRWQLIFAGILAAAVLLAVVVLIAGGGSSSAPAVNPGTSSSNSGNSGGNAISISDTFLPSPQPTPEPTPTVDTAAITSMELVFLNETVPPDITLNNDGQISIQLEVRTFPQNAEVTPEWTSSNENILTVDQTGLVKVVGVDPTHGSNATITVTCSGLTASVIIRVPQYQAPHLTENRYNAG